MPRLLSDPSGSQIRMTAVMVLRIPENGVNPPRGASAIIDPKLMMMTRLAVCMERRKFSICPVS